MEITLLRIEVIRTDGGTQPRAIIDFAAVDDYMDAMVDGSKFPPVVVFYDGTNYWLADGFHRIKATDQAGRTEIACEVHQGTQQDAQWFSFAANKTNGLRRTNDDKQRAVKAALLHPMGASKSNRQIAKHVGIAESTVREWREKLTTSAQIAQMHNRTVTRNGKTYQQNTTNIGRKQQHATPDRLSVVSELDKHPTVSQVKVSSCCPPPLNAEDHPAAEWIARFRHACMAIAECPLTANDFAASIRRSDDFDQFTKQLEKTRDFINAVLAWTDVD